MDLTILIYLGALLSSVSLVGYANSAGAFSGALSRTVAGGAASFTSSVFLVGYTNLDSFLNACMSGSLGISGFVFIGGLAALLITWVSNLIEYRSAIM